MKLILPGLATAECGHLIAVAYRGRHRFYRCHLTDLHAAPECDRYWYAAYRADRQAWRALVIACQWPSLLAITDPHLQQALLAQATLTGLRIGLRTTDIGVDADVVLPSVLKTHKESS